MTLAALGAVGLLMHIIRMSAQNNLALQSGAWWEIWPPCIAIMLTGAALVLVNFAVDEITNPQLKASRKLGRIKRFLTRRGRGADVF